jgi:hypothetical protein
MFLKAETIKQHQITLYNQFKVAPPNVSVLCRLYVQSRTIVRDLYGRIRDCIFCRKRCLSWAPSAPARTSWPSWSGTNASLTTRWRKCGSWRTYWSRLSCWTPVNGSPSTKHWHIHLYRTDCEQRLYVLVGGIGCCETEKSCCVRKHQMMLCNVRLQA